MAGDKTEEEQLSFLGLRDREMLKRLAEGECRTLIDQISWMIRARFYGHCKDLGDDRVVPRLVQRELPEIVHVKSLKLREESYESDDSDLPPPEHPKTK